MVVRYVRQYKPVAGSETGTTWKTAFNSIHEAEKASKPGDIINIAKGTYKGLITVDVDDLTLQFQDGATVDGEKRAQYNVRVLSDDVEILGGKFINSKASGIMLDGALNTVIDGVESAYNNGIGIYTMRSGGLKIINSSVHNNSEHQAGSGLSIRQPAETTVGLDNTSYHMIIKGNAFFDNGAAEFADGWNVLFDYDFFRKGVDDYQQNVLFQGNVVTGAGKAGVYPFHADNIWIADNKIYNNYAEPNSPNGGEVVTNDAYGIHMIRNDIDAAEDHFTFIGLGGGSVRWHNNQLSVENSPGDDGIDIRSAKPFIEQTTMVNKVVPYHEGLDLSTNIGIDSHDVGVQSDSLWFH